MKLFLITALVNLPQ